MSTITITLTICSILSNTWTTKLIKTTVIMSNNVVKLTCSKNALTHLTTLKNVICYRLINSFIRMWSAINTNRAIFVYLLYAKKVVVCDSDEVCLWLINRFWTKNIKKWSLPQKLLTEFIIIIEIKTSKICITRHI